jgi:hypothetical protein
VPDQLTQSDLLAAEAAVRHAVNVRKHHRRRSDRRDPQRAEDIKMALDLLRDAMVPLRSAIGRFPSEPPTSAVEEKQAIVRALSANIQGQRRRLWKMQVRPEKEAA